MAAAAGGKDPDPSLVLAMAMGCSVMPGGDDLLTRDAVTIAEYIGLMSYEAVAAEEAGMATTTERWRQVSSGGGRCWKLLCETMSFPTKDLCCDVSPGRCDPSLCVSLCLVFALSRFFPLRLPPFVQSVALEDVHSE